MTEVGPPIQVGSGVTAGPIVVSEGPVAASPVVVGDGGGVVAVEQLSNVEAFGAAPDSVLVKGNDGKWRPRPYVNVDQAISVHVSDSTPHPAYDDMPSLRLLYENGLI